MSIERNFVLLVLISFLQIDTSKGQGKGSIPIDIKDEGVDELKKEDEAMIFYITVTNTGFDLVRLYVNSSRCCQKITKDDMDCESMRLYGGDMGNLYPKDFRNLTLIYANLYLHDRSGECDVEIRDAGGSVVRRTVAFDTTLVRDGVTRVPRLMKQYYSLGDVSKCTGVDENPLNECRPYECELRYSGHRNYYNHTSGRCAKVPSCAGSEGVAYVVETNKCRTLPDQMTDFSEFREGKPSSRGLLRAHGYPINVQCHNGHRAQSGGTWCRCDPGWSSAPFDHASFDPDLQVYHMCTVWKGESEAPVAVNGTAVHREKGKDHTVTNYVVFSMLFVTFMFLCCFFCWALLKRRRGEYIYDEPEDDEAIALTTENDPYSDIE